MIKFDKSSLSRQRFWYCSAAFVLVFLISFVTAYATAPDKIEEQEKKQKASVASLDAYVKPGRPPDRIPKNPAFWGPWDEAMKRYKKRKEEVHTVAWALQKDTLTWPSSKTANFAEAWKTSDDWTAWYNKLSSANADSTAMVQEYQSSLYKRQFDTLYRTFIPSDKEELPLDRMLAPVEFKKGLEGFRQIMAPTLSSHNADPGQQRPDMPKLASAAASGSVNILNVFTQPATVEEIWYAQEDFWLKREMLRAVHRTVENAARFQPLEQGFWSSVYFQTEETKPGVKGAYCGDYRFVNGNWELHLLFEQDPKDANKVYVSSNSTIRNVDPSGRTLTGSRPSKKVARDASETLDPLIFLMTQQAKPGEKPRKFPLEVKVPRSMPSLKLESFGGQTIYDGDESIVDPRQPFELAQVFEWSNVPIRRIDDIKTCYHSHRDFPKELKFHPFFEKQAKDAAAKAAPPANLNGPALPPGMVGPQKAAQPEAPVLPAATPYNGLERRRYLNVTDTCRDLPFVMVLVLEQERINDFLVQLAASPLRIQITQVQIKRVRDVTPLPPVNPEENKEATASARSTAPGVDRNHPNPQNRVAYDPNIAPSSTNDPNLVELTVYGISAMYEKMSEKKPDVKPAAPAAPAGMK